MTAQYARGPPVTADTVGSRLANDVHRREAPKPSPSSAGQPSTTRTASSTTEYSPDYIQRMTQLVERLTEHIDAIRSHFEKVQARSHTRNEEKRGEPPVFTTTNLPGIPCMHEWTMDVMEMAMHSSPVVRDIVYPVMANVPLLWLMVPNDKTYTDNIAAKTNALPPAFLYTSKLFLEHFSDRCIESMHSLLSAFEQERHVARLLRLCLLLNHTDTKHINAFLKIAQSLFNHPKPAIRSLTFSEPWTAFASVLEHFDSQKRLLDIGLRPILNCLSSDGSATVRKNAMRCWFALAYQARGPIGHSNLIELFQVVKYILNDQLPECQTSFIKYWETAVKETRSGPFRPHRLLLDEPLRVKEIPGVQLPWVKQHLTTILDHYQFSVVNLIKHCNVPDEFFQVSLLSHSQFLNILTLSTVKPPGRQTKMLDPSEEAVHALCNTMSRIAQQLPEPIDYDRSSVVMQQLIPVLLEILDLAKHEMPYGDTLVPPAFHLLRVLAKLSRGASTALTDIIKQLVTIAPMSGKHAVPYTSLFSELVSLCEDNSHWPATFWQSVCSASLPVTSTDWASTPWLPSGTSLDATMASSLLTLLLYPIKHGWTQKDLFALDWISLLGWIMRSITAPGDLAFVLERLLSGLHTIISTWKIADIPEPSCVPSLWSRLKELKINSRLLRNSVLIVNDIWAKHEKLSAVANESHCLPTFSVPTNPNTPTASTDLMLLLCRIAYERFLEEDGTRLPSELTRLFARAETFITFCPARHARDLATVTTKVLRLFVDDPKNKLGDFPLGNLRELNNLVPLEKMWCAMLSRLKHVSLPMSTTVPAAIAEMLETGLSTRISTVKARTIEYFDKYLSQRLDLVYPTSLEPLLPTHVRPTTSTNASPKLTARHFAAIGQQYKPTTMAAPSSPPAPAQGSPRIIKPIPPMEEDSNLFVPVSSTKKKNRPLTDKQLEAQESQRAKRHIPTMYSTAEASQHEHRPEISQGFSQQESRPEGLKRSSPSRGGNEPSPKKRPLRPEGETTAAISGSPITGPRQFAMFGLREPPSSELAAASQSPLRYLGQPASQPTSSSIKKGRKTARDPFGPERRVSFGPLGTETEKERSAPPSRAAISLPPSRLAISMPPEEIEEPETPTHAAQRQIQPPPKSAPPSLSDEKAALAKFDATANETLSSLKTPADLHAFQMQVIQLQQQLAMKMMEQHQKGAQ